MSRLQARGLTLAYGEHEVVHTLDLAIPDGSFTAIVGPNACGKSTLLRALARLMPARAGVVLLDGADVHRTPTREIARAMGLLPQSQTMPEGVTVKDLVSRGRFAHQSFLRRWSEADQQALDRALRLCGLDALAHRRVESLSGGQRQRAWLATVVAQDPGIILLDEPTTYLDLAHQLDVLDLCAAMQHEGRTVVAVLHDLNLAARYASHMVAMADGRVMASGSVRSVMTAPLVSRVFGLDCRIVDDPETGTPMVIPLRRPCPDEPAGTEEQ